MKAKRIACLILTMMLVAGVIPAQAIELTTPGGTVTTDVTLEANGSGQEPEIFSVTVPTELPIRMDKNGNITAGDNLFIENHSSKDVKVTAISVEGKNGWSIADYGDDFSTKGFNTKELGLSLRGDTTQAGGHVALTPENWVVRQEESLDIMASARLGRQSKSDESDIATIDWTLDWADASTKPDIPVPPVTSLTVEYENGLMLPGSSNSATFRLDSTDRAVTLVNVVSSNPEVADVIPSAVRTMPRSTRIYRSEEMIAIEAKTRGTAVFTGTISTGESATFTVSVYELDKAQTPIITVKDADKLKAGDTVKADDITVALPVFNPDGTKGSFPIHPDTVPDIKLDEGTNLLPLTIDANGISIDATAEITTPSTNPSNGLKMSVSEAQDAGFTFASFQGGLAITGFENKQLKSAINVPEQIGDFKVLKIADEAFDQQTNLTSITLPDTVTVFGKNAFRGCSNLKFLSSPKNLKEVGERAVSSCRKLESFTLHESVTKVGDYAFYGDDNLSLNLKGIPANISAEAISTGHTSDGEWVPSIKSLNIYGTSADFYPISTKIASIVAKAVADGTVVTLISDGKRDIVPVTAVANKTHICQNADYSWADVPANGTYPANLGDVYYPVYFNGKAVTSSPPTLKKVSVGDGTRVHFAGWYNLEYPEEAWIDINKPRNLGNTIYNVNGYASSVGNNDDQKKANAFVFWHFLNGDVIMGMDVTGYKLMSHSAPTITSTKESGKITALTITVPGAKNGWENNVRVLPACLKPNHSSKCSSEINLSYFLQYAIRIGSPTSKGSSTQATWTASEAGGDYGIYNNGPHIYTAFWIRDDVNKTFSLPVVFSGWRRTNPCTHTVTIGTWTQRVCNY